MISNRRAFLIRVLAASNALLLSGAQSTAMGNNSELPRSLRVLILGGTGFIGPSFVKAAVERGHKVSVFSRGKSEAALPAPIERLVGDRNGNLESIRHRDWDAVIDLATYVPSWVRTLGEVLKGRVGHYAFISTSAVYDPLAITGEIRESTPVLRFGGNENPYSVGSPTDLPEYGALKALCEQEGENQFPDRTLILRPGYIVGPGDSQGYLAYWPLRAEKGGEMLVAGNPSTPVQFIDVRDLAAYGIRMIERNARGIYNTVGPATPTNLAQLVKVACTSTSDQPKFAWVPSFWLATQKRSQMWSKLLFWSERSPVAWTMRMNIDRALASGLAIRPLSATLSDTLDWHKQQPAEWQAEFLSVASSRIGSEKVPISWDIYLAREKEVLASWSVTAARRIAQ
jgi:2'-hydroxyisoflavone reductase